MTVDMLSAAKALLSCGFSVIPVSADGTKSPKLSTWKPYQSERATVDQLEKWFAGNHPGVGVITGTISGNLEMLEFEGRAIAEDTHAAFFHALDRAGGADLLARIAAGYLETSPSGGLHFYYRVTAGEVGGSVKLAQRPAFDDELTGDERERLTDKGKRATRTLIETRGEGGFVVVAPSHGTVHATGKAWESLNGSIATVATITGAERDMIHACAMSLDQIPLPEPIPDPRPALPNMLPGDLTPGEDFNKRASWESILLPHGWTLNYDTGIRAYWCRPGKRDGNSAVTGGERGDYFHAWSTSTELPAETTMSKWRVWTFLNHGGNFSAAASALRGQGFGSPRRDAMKAISADDRWVPGEVTPDVPDGGAANGSAPVIGHQHAATTPVATTVLLTDDGNAHLLIEQYGSVIRFCPESGKWLSWQGKSWEWAHGKNGGIVREYSKRIARSLSDADKDAMRHRRYSLSAMGTTNMLTQAATDPRIAIRINDLDNRPFELNTPDGIVDLRTGQLMAHNPDNLHTRMTLVGPDFDADKGEWQKFLATTFAGHEDIVPYIQRLAGYSASGVVGEHLLPFAFGSGRNGKGVFLETIRETLGDYGLGTPNSFLMAHQYAQHETEIARLSGARMVICSEVNIEDRFDEAKVKQLTGGDVLTARFMRKDHFTFKPTHKLWLMGNDQPAVSNGGPAFWERLRIIPFANTVARADRIVDLQEKLVTEHGPAVLAWVITGALGYFSMGGLQEPKSITSATEDYAGSQDSVTQWFEQCCQLSSAHVKQDKSIVKHSYEQWCKREGLTPVNKTRFGNELKNHHGVTSHPTPIKGKRFYTNLILLDSSGSGQQDYLGLDK